MSLKDQQLYRFFNPTSIKFNILAHWELLCYNDFFFINLGLILKMPNENDKILSILTFGYITQLLWIFIVRTCTFIDAVSKWLVSYTSIWAATFFCYFCLGIVTSYFLLIDFTLDIILLWTFQMMASQLSSCGTVIIISMMTSSPGNIFRITGPLWEKSTSHWWILLTKASDKKLWCFLWSVLEQMVEQAIEMLAIWDAIMPIVMSP